MPGAFKWLDGVIVLFLILAVIQGLRAGLLKTVFSILGLVAALTMGYKYYARVSSFILSYISLPHFIVDLIAFLFIFSSVILAVHYLGELISSITRLKFIRFLDKTGGGFAGLLLGLTTCGVILILLTAFPTFDSMQDHLETSTLSPPIIGATTGLYSELANILPLELPELLFYPEEMGDYLHSLGHLIEHRGINFSALDSSTCFVCGGSVSFIGYHSNSKESISPKFVCNHCGRTSDGCQTYEGYHLMYEQCPVELGNIGYRFDCGIWSNNSYHRPVGPCPVCASDD